MKNTELKWLIALGIKTIGEAGYYIQQLKKNSQMVK